jgi:Pyruvate/2-oxoacid:ferredoxin oxidoreductase delta subunit
LILEHFQAPDLAAPYLEYLLTKDEFQLITFVERGQEFKKEEIAEILGKNIDVNAFAEEAYRHGVISYTDESMTSYKLGDFYDFLDIYAISQQERYRALPKEDQKILADWAFDMYYSRLNPDLTVRPSNDEVLPLEEMLALIEERKEMPVYLNYCDCKSLNGDCGKPKQVCITYRDGVNSYVHRGLSKKITAEEAKQVVMEADKAGLMHTISGMSICNCCDDCCYVFRSQQRRGSLGFWPKTEHIISWNGKKCVHCGLCIRRCMMKVFAKPGDRITIDTSKCVGCGICATACPKGALELIKK